MDRQNRNLRGHIFHHLSFASLKDPIEQQPLRKAVRNEKSGAWTSEKSLAPNTPTASNKRPRPRSEFPQSNSNFPDFNLSKSESMNKPKIGFFFMPLPSIIPVPITLSTSDKVRITDDHELESEYQIIAPHATLHSVIDAVRFRLEVILTEYKIIEVLLAEGKTHSPRLFLLELHNNGIVVCQTQQDRKNQNPTPPFMSLKELQVVEKQMIKEKKPKSECARERKSKQTRNPQIHFNIKGTVDALSPIMGLLENDPFSLVELYDTENDPSLTAVIVLKGENALICQQGMYPGSLLTFSNLKRQRWHVPQSFQKDDCPQRLWDRAPSHVFVMTDAKSVAWDANLDINGKENDHDDDECVLSTPLPMTVDSLTALQGRVVAVKYISAKKPGTAVTSDVNGRIIQYVMIRSTHADEEMVKLYLRYFPMSPSLLLGLREGSYIRAVNVHRIDSHIMSGMRRDTGSNYNCVGACLRSTVSILAAESEFSFTFHGHHDKVESHVVTYCVTHLLNPVKYSYFELEWISLCRKQLSNCTRIAGNQCIERNLRKIISNNMNETNCNSTKSRFPYKEWFDHACDNVLEVKDSHEVLTCPCETYYLREGSKEKLPFTIGLGNLKQLCLNEMIKRLSKHCRSLDNGCNNTNQVGFGCTASVHLAASTMLKMICRIGHEALYVGGIVGNTDPNGQIRSCIDGKFQLTFSPCTVRECSPNENVNSNVSYNEGDFALVRVHKGIVSSLYLGKYEDGDNEDSTNTSATVINLPSLMRETNKEKEGPSSVVKIGSRYYLVSIQIQYVTGNIISVKGNSSLMKEEAKNISAFFETSRPTETMIPFRGRLTRQRWNIRKETNYYIGCRITVSYAKHGTLNESFLYHMPQAVEIKLRIPLSQIPGYNHDAFSAIEVLPKRVVSMALAWQFAAESHYAPLISGGWDELKPDNDNDLGFSEVYVILPEDKKDRKQSINIELCTFQFLEKRTTKETAQYFPTEGKNDFTYYGGRKMNNGMLDIRVRRVVSQRLPSYRGEIKLPPNLIIGLPDVSLTSMQSLQYCNSSQSEQNRLFKIKSAHLSKIRFCRARAECSRCYSALVDGKIRQSFWDNPLPISTILNPSKTKSTASHGAKSTLVCPSGCDRRYAYIKWEMSGIIKDSTGTAKLYTERETTLLLLGDELNLGIIEEGVWHSPNGICHQVGVPLPSEVKTELRLAEENDKRMRNGQKSKPAGNLCKDLKARYELHRHCIYSDLIHRQMDFICAIKNRRKESETIMKPVEISLMTSLGDKGGILQSSDTSMMMPTLELRLIDCVQTVDEPKDLGWSIIEALKAPKSQEVAK